MNARIEELFHELADMPTEARAQYFARNHVDAETRREVEALLAFDAGVSGVIVRNISVVASQVLPHLETASGRCGPYRLLKVIGRGGMGAVYLAERVDGEVSQQVAVKLLPPGAGSVYRDRFLQERQILAKLTHPNIARMLDAGHLESGQPYLAMEYVAGKSIDEFTAGFGVDRRIALFQKVCSAVSYLHRNLIVHRDLKPSNILVTADGEPKLLDFGIAKMLDLSTDATVTSMRILTPDYASPEQVTGSTVSTASDIYSLGAVLYRLLTGKPAHDFTDTTPQAITTAVVSREVTRPSRWAPSLKGDLDAILMKALRKDPQDRYATVEQFAEDLQAFLESLPVRARSGNAVYRARKFVRRYWVPLLAGSLVTASLTAGILVANRERVIAERRFIQVRQLADEFLALDSKIQSLPGATQARHEIVSKSLAYLEGLGREVHNDRALALDIGTAYMQVARVQGVPTGSNLGDFDEADKTLAKAEQFVDSVLREDPKNHKALRVSAEIAHDRMILANGGPPDGVKKQAEKARSRLDALLAMPGATSDDRTGAVRILTNMAQAYGHLGLYREAITVGRRAVSISEGGGVPSAMQGKAYGKLADALRRSGDLDAALDAARKGRSLAEHGTFSSEMQRALALDEAYLAEGSILWNRNNISLNRPEEASDAYRKSFELMDGLADKDRSDSLSRFREIESGYGLVHLSMAAEPQRALALSDRCLLRLRETRPTFNRAMNEADFLSLSATALSSFHRVQEAKVRLDEARRILEGQKQLDAGTVKVGSAAETYWRSVAAYEAASGDLKASASTLQALLQSMLLTAAPNDDLRGAYHVSQIDEELASVYRRMNDAEKAAHVDGERQALWRKWDARLPGNPFIRSQLSDFVDK